MRHNWKFGQQIMLPAISGRTLKEVLIEYDGPQLTILEKGPDQFLAICFDEDQNGTRWLQSPLSHLEYDALMCGALAVRDALLKPELILVEIGRDDHPRHIWQLEPSTVPDEILPERDALLPEYVRESFLLQLEPLAPDVPARFHFGAKGVTGHKISFSRLSQVTDNLQHLLASLASTISTEELTLNAVAFEPGSFSVSVEVDNQELFAKVAEAYRDLNRATYDETKLIEALGRTPAAVSQNYSHFLRTLDINRLDVFTQWREDTQQHAAFVGYAGAQRTRKSALKSLKQIDVKRESITVSGYFEGFGRNPGHFEFYDVESGKRIDGTIQKSLRDIPIVGEVHLGHRLKYRAEIQTIQVSGKGPKSTLMAFARVED